MPLKLIFCTLIELCNLIAGTCLLFRGLPCTLFSNCFSVAIKTDADKYEIHRNVLKYVQNEHTHNKLGVGTELPCVSVCVRKTRNTRPSYYQQHHEIDYRDVGQHLRCMPTLQLFESLCIAPVSVFSEVCLHLSLLHSCSVPNCRCGCAWRWC